MAASDLSTVAYIYKRRYSDRQVGDIAKRNHPTYSAIAKEPGFNGSAFYYPIRYGNPQGLSGAFASAQSGAASSKGVQLVASRKSKYAVITLDGEAMAAAEGDAGAFLDLVTQETDGVIEEVGDTLGFDLFRAGNGIRGQRSSAATNVITLVVADDVRNFKVGMTVGASPNADGSSPRTGSTTVTSIDEDSGTITLASAAAITSFANNDYMFRVGDPGTCMEGFESHFPLTAPVGGDSFRGIDRSVDVRGLAGSRVNQTTDPVEENVGLCAVKISQRGKRANYVAMNPIVFWAAVRRLNAKVTYDGGGMKAAAGFEGFDIHTPAGTLRCVSDPDCQTTRAWVLNLDTLYIKHLKGLPHIVSDDGRPSLRQASADAIEARVRLWCNLICTEPGSNGVVAC